MSELRQRAEELDRQDPLRSFRDQYIFPRKLAQPCIYFTGNSLGLQPKATKEYIHDELEAWADYGVEGHFHGKNPWFHYHKLFPEKLRGLTGAKEIEVVAMNTLTANLHFLLVSFYKPSGKRIKIITEGGNFPSDYYALETQAIHHGHSFEDVVVEIFPRDGEDSLRTEDILSKIDELEDELALVMMSGVNYYTGQSFDLEKITKAAHSVGAKAGFDLAHAIGNVELKLHDWDVDFATWCSYKYLNSGPGGPGGIFVHERYADDKNLNRFAGWWGYHEPTRFKMEKGYIPMPGAAGWQLSNAQVLGMAAHLSALDLFEKAGMKNLIEKRTKMVEFLSASLERIQEEVSSNSFKILTPKGMNDRGCQYSIVIEREGKKVFDQLAAKGVVADWREPDVIRIAPVPMYNSFLDLAIFSELFKEALENV